MKTVYDARRANLTELLKEKGAKTALALKLGTTQPFISHMLRDPKEKTARPIHEDMARQIERELGLADGALDLPFTRGAPNWALIGQALRLVVQVAAALGTPLNADSAARAVRAVYEAAPQMGGVDSAATRALVEALLRA